MESNLKNSPLCSLHTVLRHHVAVYHVLSVEAKPNTLTEDFEKGQFKISIKGLVYEIKLKKFPTVFTAHCAAPPRRCTTFCLWRPSPIR